MTESAALRLVSLAAGYPKAWGAEAIPKMGGSDLRRKKRQICSYGTRQKAFRFAMWASGCGVGTARRVGVANLAVKGGGRGRGPGVWGTAQVTKLTVHDTYCGEKERNRDAFVSGFAANLAGLDTFTR